MEGQDAAVAYPKSTVLNQEVRFAVVMYGGISLCIYMNGITDQLWHAVRATARKGADAEADDYLIDLDGPLRNNDWNILRVYRRLAQARTALSDRRRRTAAGIPVEEGERAAKPYQTADDQCRFVVDILSGTSAGGINSLFLSKALSCEETLSSLATLWIAEGDISLLMNDSGSKGIGIPNEVPPQSLLNSQRMAQKLLDAFRAMGPDPNIKPPPDDWTKGSRLVQQLDLFMTSTDLAGLDLSLDIESDRKITELRHKAVFHFVNDPLDAPVIGQQLGRNDFTTEMVPFLTFVARATSCIVPAFEPMQLNDIAKLRDENAPSPEAKFQDSTKYASFFRDYWSNSLIASMAAPAKENGQPQIKDLPAYQDQQQKLFGARAFGDGGYGNNAPFNWAVNSLATRRAELKVDRKLLYIEPDPDLPSEGTDAAVETARPNVLGHASAAVGVMTSQPIREQIDRLRDRNRSLAHMGQIKQSISGKEAMLPGITNAYLRLRASGTTDDLSDLFVSLFGFEQDSIYWEAVRYVAHTVREHVFPGDDTIKLNSFLDKFDLGFRQREIGYLVGLADEMMENNREIGTARDVKAKLLVCNSYVDHWFAAIRLHGTVTFPNMATEAFWSAPIETNGPDRNRYDRLKTKISSELPMDGADFTWQIAALKAAAGALIHTYDLADIILSTSDYDERQKVADGKVSVQNIDRFVSLLDGVFAPLRKKIDEVIEQQAVRVASEGWTEAFSGLDAWLFPAYYVSGTPETNRIDLLRVSPLDCNSLVPDPEAAKHKLAGTGMGHFSGFFHPAWRGQDIIWGRLDGAERMICSVLDQNSFERSLLIFQAQLAILAMNDVDQAVDKAMQDMSGLRALAPNETMFAFRSSLLHSAVAAFRLDVDGWVRAGEQLGDYQIGDNGIPTLLRIACEAGGTFDGASDGLHSSLMALWNGGGIYSKAEPEPRYGLELAGRSLRVVGNILDGISKDGNSSNKIAKTAARVGAGIVAVVKIITPGSIEGSLYRNWLALLAATTFITLGIGIFNETILKAGWSLLGITALIVAAVELTRLAVGDADTRRTLLKAAGALLCLALICGFGYAIFASWADSTARQHNVRILSAALAGGSMLLVAIAWTMLAKRPSARFDRTIFAESLLTIVVFVASVVTFVAFFHGVPESLAAAAALAALVLCLNLAVGVAFGRRVTQRAEGRIDPTETRR